MSWLLALNNVSAAPVKAKASRIKYDEQGRRLKRCRLCGPQYQPIENFYRRGEGKYSARCKAHQNAYNVECLRRYRARQKQKAAVQS